jgi:subtilisin family serine protease
MKPPLKILIPFILIGLILTLSACEISRDESADLPPTPPEAGQPVTAVPGATEEPVTEPDELPVGEQYAAPQAPDMPPEPGKSLVKLTAPAAIEARESEINSQGFVATGIGSLDQTLQQLGATSIQPVIEPVADGSGESLDSLTQRMPPAVNQLYVVTFDASIPPEQASTALAQDPNVEYAEPNFFAGIMANPVNAPAPLTPNDPYYGYQWHFDAIQMPAAWEMATGQNVVVAVVDTGIDFAASDLAGTNRRPGYDFANGDNDPTDDQGHGTHVAGTIAQTTNNGLGVAGVAFNSTLMPVKVLGKNGQGSYETIIQGIIYAVDQGANVINMSLAGRQGSQALEDAINYAYQRNVVVVAAAGNSNGPVQYPAAYNNIIAVGAVQFDKTRAPYSNYGPQIDLMAPGGNTKVDQNNDGYGDGILQQTYRATGSGFSYRFFEGTSMASPHVTAVAALMKSVKPEATVDQIKNAMLQTAVNIGPSDQFGAGLLQAANALGAIGGQPPQIPTDTPTPVPPTAEPTIEPTSEPTTAPTTEPPTPTETPAPPVVTDTPTPTATPLPLPPGQLLTNGGFETDETWVFGDTPIRGGYDTSVVLSGNRSARLGATSGYNAYSFSSVWQKVTIPAEANRVVLETNTYPLTEDTCGIDLQYIAILNANFRMTMPLSVGLSNSRTWEHNTFDVTDMRGQTIFVYFSVLNRGCSGLTAMYVDDVSLRWE